jgi:hypothetical protein
VARHLAARVDAGVRAAGHRERNAFAERGRERVLEHALDGAQPVLARPAGEVATVVGDQEAGRHRDAAGSRPSRSIGSVTVTDVAPAD